MEGVKKGLKRNCTDYGAKNPDESQLNFGVVKDMYVKNTSTFEYVPTLVGT